MAAGSLGTAAGAFFFGTFLNRAWLDGSAAETHPPHQRMEETLKNAIYHPRSIRCRDIHDSNVAGVYIVPGALGHMAQWLLTPTLAGVVGYG